MSFRINSRPPFAPFPINLLFPSSIIIPHHSMSSVNVPSGVSLPDTGSSPFINVNWGVRTHGLEACPPCLGVDEFAIINPNFWGQTAVEQEQFKGWYRFVSELCSDTILVHSGVGLPLSVVTSIWTFLLHALLCFSQHSPFRFCLCFDSFLR